MERSTTCAAWVGGFKAERMGVIPKPLPSHPFPPTTAQPIGMTVPLSLKIAAAYLDPLTHLFSHSPQN